MSRYQNRVLSKSLSLCTCNNPFYSAYKSLIHRVNFGQTIHAPCCQGNVVVFGENAEQQCVAMSLCALIYSKIRRITSVNDMIPIMTVGSQLYSSLPLLARQSNSESYTCNMHGYVRIEEYHYCMPLESLLALNYNSFILTVGIIGVDSHARDVYCQQS